MSPHVIKSKKLPARQQVRNSVKKKRKSAVPLLFDLRTDYDIKRTKPTGMTSLLSKASKAIAVGGVGLGAVAVYRYQNLLDEESKLPTNELFRFDGLRQGRKGDKDQNPNKKQLIVIGGGVVGITAAYKAALKGHSVVLLENRSEPGKECSACAAGGMQRSNPVVDMGTWIAVTKCIMPATRFILGGPNEPYKFFHIDWLKSITDPFFLRWSFASHNSFARTSFLPPSDQTDKQKEMLAFTEYAVADMTKMMKDKKDNMAVKSGYNPSGSLSLTYDAPSPSTAAVKEDTKEKPSSPSINLGKATTAKTEGAAPKANPTGGKALEPYRQISGKDATAIESSILHQANQPTSAKYEYESSAASSERFTEELAERCLNDPKLDVTILYDTKVKAVTTDTTDDGKATVTQLRTNKGYIDVPKGTQVLNAAGAWVPHIMALMGVYAPVYPLKGYAMSVSAQDILSRDKNLKPEDLPRRIVSDKYMYTSRLGDEIRITSIGEFSGWETKPTPSVEAEFVEEAVRQFPQLEPYIREAKTRCGHRPYVSDGIVLLGRVKEFDNLLISAGPGSNGWKLAMGSGDIVERLISGQTEDDISKELGFCAYSFSPAGRVKHSPLFAKLCRARWNV